MSVLAELPTVALDKQPILLSPADNSWLDAGECFVVSDLSFEQLRGDSSATTNPALLSQFLRPVSLYTLPFFGGKLDSPQTIEKIAKKIEKTLAQILD